MSKQPSSSSSFISTTVGPQFNSGLAQSLGGFSPDAKRSLVQPGSPSSPTASGVRRWEIRYDELKFDKELGKGAYGEVWAGTYRKSKVAIKVYDFRGALTQEQQAAVLNEADLMEGLRSEYLIGFRGICFDPRYCLVMEYGDGGTLRARLDNTREEITLPEQMRWSMQVSYGLHQLHSVRIVHRDLKGENILLDKSDDAKVADFGLSVVKSSSASQSKKGSGHGGAGTLPWMAPELFDRKPNSPETDMYSLGMVMWEILSRKVPFVEAMPMAIVGMVMMGKREDLPEKCPEVFRLMITACWNADPKQRPTAEQVGDQFDAALKSLEPTPKFALKKEDKYSSGRELEAMRQKMAQMELELKKFSTPTKTEFRTPASQSSLILMSTPKPADEKALSQLLQYVAEGEQDKAEALIQKDKNLLLHAGTVTDLSSREFKQITAFQYALWAMDWHMWTMIQKYLPREAQAEQLKTLETKGTAHGKHFNLQELTDALQVHVDNVKEVWKFDQRAIDYWCKVVGGAQKKLPAHVVNEYCRGDRPFHPCPTEWESKLPRTQEVPEIWDRTQYRYVRGSWFIPSSSKNALGLTYAFFGGPCQLWGRDQDGAYNCKTSKLSNPCGKHALSSWSCCRLSLNYHCQRLNYRLKSIAAVMKKRV